VDFLRFSWAQFVFKNIKVEKGNKATDWTPAPEDVDNALDVFRTETETNFSVQQGLIASKVAQNDFNALGQRVSTAESNVIQTANELKSKVSQTAFDSLENSMNGVSGRITAAETEISQQAGQIEQRATKTEVSTDISNAKSEAIGTAANDASNKANQAESNSKGYTDGQVSAVATRVTTAETKITQNAEQIDFRATKTEVAALKKDTESAITILADEIEQKVSSTDFNTLGQRVGSTETGITNLSNALTLQSQSLDNVTGRVQSAEAKITPNAINLVVGEQIDDKVKSIDIG
ncbi:hypothetical protein ACFSQ3_06065, partial [Sphingobacterium corticis]